MHRWEGIRVRSGRFTVSAHQSMKSVNAGPARVIAACFAMSAFAVAVISGAATGNPAAQILLRALVAMTVCYPVGLIAGLICARVIDAHVREHAAGSSSALPTQPAEPAPAQQQDALIV
jgi:hypothetical protein